MDPATLTAIFGGITSILGGAALLIRQIRASDEEDVKKLRGRVERAEKRVDELESELEEEQREHKKELDDVREEARAENKQLREKLNETELRMWKLERILRQNSIDPDADVVV